MKKSLFLFFSLLFTTLLFAQHSITINGPSSIEVGVPYDYTFQFNPFYPWNISGTVQADAYIITEWVVLTGTNGYSGSIIGYINTPSNQSSYYYDGTYDNSNPITIPIQWGNGTYSSSDEVTVKVSGIYIKRSTNEVIGYFTYQPQKTQSVTVQRLIEPLISGPSSVKDCDQTNATFSISNLNQTNGNQFLWSASNGAVVVGATTGTTVTIKPPLSNNFSVFCTVKRSGANTNYSVSGSKSVMRDTFTSSATISGSSTICSTQNYSISGLLAGESVSWSLSNSTSGTLSTTTGTSTTITKTGGGPFTLTATILNACGTQVTTKTKNLYAGAPLAFAVARGTAESEYCDTKYHYVPFTISNKSPLLSYSVNVAGMPPSAVSSYTSDGFVLKFSKTFSGYVVFTVTASNSCGTANVYREAHIDNCSSIPYGSQSKTSEPVSVFKVYPNPSNDVVYLDLVDTNYIPEKNAQIKARLYDMLGFEKKNIKVKDNKAVIGVSDLTSGLYVLKVSINGETETHLISRK